MIRNDIEKSIGPTDADIWTGLVYISKNYLVFANALLTLYVLPKFASIYTFPNFKKELLSIYKTLMPLFFVGMLLIFIFKDFAISILFKGDYSAMSPLFKWQLMGDFVRLLSVILATQFLAKKMVRNFIFTELLSHALFFGFSLFFIQKLGIVGVVVAHFVRYVLYFMIVLFLSLIHI